jgi:CheY-like chemotaxis protein
LEGIMAKAKVLIVEDDPLIALTMREVLTLVGFEVAGATVGEALRIAEGARPDLAVSTSALPVDATGSRVRPSCANAWACLPCL